MHPAVGSLGAGGSFRVLVIRLECAGAVEQHLAILGVLAAGCLAGPSSLLAARPAPVPAGGPQQPQAIAVPADVVAAHPNGQPGGLTGVVEPSDRATLTALLDPDGPHSLLRRTDLHIRGTRTITVARRR